MKHPPGPTQYKVDIAPAWEGPAFFLIKGRLYPIWRFWNKAMERAKIPAV